MSKQNLPEDSSLPLGAEIKITQSPLIQMRKNTKLGLSMTPRSVQSGDRSARNGPLPKRHHQSGGGRRRKSASPGQLTLLSRTPFCHPEGGGSPKLCSSERGKHGSHSGPLPGCSPFSSCSQAGAPWPWLRDTAATLGMTLPTPSTPEGRAGSKQLWGMGVRVTPEASDVRTHTPWH